MTLVPSYDRWRKRLAGEKVVTYTEPDEGDLGFYRLPVRERVLGKDGKTNGQWKTIGWQPVALFVIGDEMVAQIGDHTMTGYHIGEQWPWFVTHPIPEETWRAVAERGEPWPDAQ